MTGARALRAGVTAALLTALAGCALLPDPDLPTPRTGTDSATAGPARPPSPSTGTRPTDTRPTGTGPTGTGPTGAPAGCRENTALPGTPVSRHLTPMPGTAASLRALDALVIAERSRGDDFCRSAFGPSTWPDLDGNGCSARQDTLRRQGREVRLGIIASHATGCREVLSGTWLDAYTGERLVGTNMKDPRIAASIQIDHVVSLFNAWVSGARAWPAQRRVQFANDTSIHELYAVAAATNFDKSYRGAESWRPRPAYQCRFARAYVEVKSTYRLTVIPAERDALRQMLATC
ncbi:MAG TPA: hypothetical protein PLK69_01245 [Tetrasphaera sp.]|nr:hypothetical protein [Tetrasphaera sp.]